jgi:hypothetical protein
VGGKGAKTGAKEDGERCMGFFMPFLMILQRFNGKSLTVKR